MIPLSAITDQDWQPALGTIGDVVTDANDIGQCIRIILATPKLADPLRPEFGCNIWRYLDQPLATALPHMVREAWTAIETWEPRAELVRITPAAGEQPGHAVLTVVWRRAGVQSVTEVAL